MTRWDTAIVWFRRDLRLHDHPALAAAVAGARSVLPLFVLDSRLLGEAAAPARRWFLARSLVELDRSLRERGSGLLIRTGDPDTVVPQVARDLRAEVVLASRDVTPFSHRRDTHVAEALERDGRRLLLQPGLLLAEPETMLTAAGSPYTVFTPFWRSLGKAPRRTPLPAPTSVDTPSSVMDSAPDVLDRLSQEEGSVTAQLAASLPEPGERAAQRRLRECVAGGLRHYGERREWLSGEGTSHLSPDLHVGTLSPLQVETAALELGEPAVPFVRQVAWRELYHHQLFHRRAVTARSEDALMAAFREERDDREAVAAWRAGRTGIPVVDAAMRQLTATAWMSNRARLIVASFLTRHLLMDYRIGERHFLRHLIDGDVANNGGGWRWSAGVGSDAQPWFRVFNPVLQGRRFDPDGTWVRRWVPELARVPVEHVHDPWELADGDLQTAGVLLGETYPHPIVDLLAARGRALDALSAIRR